jgi:dsRNA-specific ribonuclease/ankyrin repeat protein
MFRTPFDYADLKEKLNYKFKNKNLLLQALTRPSALNEGIQYASITSFQRLEFIGDKILNLIVSDILMERYPTWSEGELTKEVAKFVNNNGPLAKVAYHLGLNDYLIMGKGEELNNRARTNEKVLSDAVEALLGAMWIDSGHDYKLLRQFIIIYWKPLGLHPLMSTSDLIKIFNDSLDEVEIFEAFQQWLEQQVTASEFYRIATDYLFSSYDTERPECLRLLLAKDLLDQDQLDGLLAASFNFYDPDDEIDEKGSTERIASIRLLLEYGANANTITYRGQLLFTAVTYQCSNEAIELLLQYGAETDWSPGKVRIKTKPSGLDKLGNREVSLSILFKMAKKPACYEWREDTNTALHKVAAACYFIKSDLELVKLLISYGANINLPNEAGKTALHLACESLLPTRDELLVLDIVDYDYSSKKLAIDFLIDSQADINYQDKQGNTPMHLLLKKWLSKNEKSSSCSIFESFPDNLYSRHFLETFLLLFKKILSTKGDLTLENHAGESVIDLANSINLSRHELSLIANNSELFFQPLKLNKLSYNTLSDLIPNLAKPNSSLFRENVNLTRL